MIVAAMLCAIGNTALSQSKDGATSPRIMHGPGSSSAPALVLENGLNPAAVLIRNKETICMATDWINHYPLIAQRVDSAGRLLWKTVQISIPRNSIDQNGKGIILPRLDGGAYSIFEFWEFKQRSGDVLLYASYPHVQSVDTSGNVLWGTDGKRLTNMTVGYQGGGHVLSTNYSSDGSVIAYWDWFSEDSLYRKSSGVYVQKIDGATGRLQWEESGRRLFDYSPAFAVSNKYGTTYIGHRDSAACFDPDGQLRWDCPVWNGITGQLEYTVVADDNGELLILYTSNEGIRGRLYGPDGQPLWIDRLIVPGEDRIFFGTKLTKWGSARWVFKMWNSVLCIDRSGVLFWRSGISVATRILDAAPVDSENVFVAFQKPREGENFTYDLLLQKINARGECVWRGDGIKIFEMVSTNCLLIPDSAGGAFMIFDALAHYEPEFHSRGTFFQRIDKDGNPGVITAIVRDDVNQKTLPVASATSFPNPFTDETTIRLTTGSSAPEEHARLVVYDILGREVRRFSIQDLSNGFLSIRWDGRDNRGAEVAPGVYLYNAAIRDNVSIRGKLLHMR